MLRRFLVGIGLVLVAPALVGCTNRAPGDARGGCVSAPGLDIEPRVVDPIQLVATRDGVQDDSLSCDVKAVGGWRGTVATTSPIGFDVDVRCETTPAGFSALWLHFNLGDLRDLEPGTYPIAFPTSPCGDAESPPQVWWAYWLHGASVDAPCCFRFPAGAARLVVEKAVGSSAPYPDVVTPDYSRAFRVEVKMPSEGPGVPWLGGAAGVCDGTLGLTMSVGFELAPGDVTVDPGAQVCGG